MFEKPILDLGSYLESKYDLNIFEFMHEFWIIPTANMTYTNPKMCITRIREPPTIIVSFRRWIPWTDMGKPVVTYLPQSKEKPLPCPQDCLAITRWWQLERCHKLWRPLQSTWQTTFNTKPKSYVYCTYLFYQCLILWTLGFIGSKSQDKKKNCKLRVLSFIHKGSLSWRILYEGLYFEIYQFEGATM